MNINAKLFNSWYVGIAYERDGTKYNPLGFMVPYEGADEPNAATKKRIETIKSWTREYRFNPNIKDPSATPDARGWVPHIRDVNHPNPVFRHLSDGMIPIEGFKLSHAVRRNGGWNSGNVVWRIEDPRGFELEISSSNMCQIMLQGIVDNGDIKGPCVWARMGAQNILVPEGTDLYEEVMESHNRHHSKDITDLVEGEYYLNRAGDLFKYIGYGYHVSYTQEHANTHNYYTQNWLDRPSSNVPPDINIGYVYTFSFEVSHRFVRFNKMRSGGPFDKYYYASYESSKKKPKFVATYTPSEDESANLSNLAATAGRWRSTFFKEEPVSVTVYSKNGVLAKDVKFSDKGKAIVHYPFVRKIHGPRHMTPGEHNDLEVENGTIIKYTINT